MGQRFESPRRRPCFTGALGIDEVINGLELIGRAFGLPTFPEVLAVAREVDPLVCARPRPRAARSSDELRGLALAGHDAQATAERAEEPGQREHGRVQFATLNTADIRLVHP